MFSSAHVPHSPRAIHATYSHTIPQIDWSIWSSHNSTQCHSANRFLAPATICILHYLDDPRHLEKYNIWVFIEWVLCPSTDGVNLRQIRLSTQKTVHNLRVDIFTRAKNARKRRKAAKPREEGLSAQLDNLQQGWYLASFAAICRFTNRTSCQCLWTSADRHSMQGNQTF